VKSFTRGVVSPITIDKRFLKKDEQILIVDDFMAEGNASLGLVDLCQQAGAKVEGVAWRWRRASKAGHAKLNAMGIPVRSGADIAGFDPWPRFVCG
jgi:xanthine phosphoribosyltransferase